MIYTINPDNNITAHAAAPAAQDNLVVFASQKELTKATAEWPIARFADVWNAFVAVTSCLILARAKSTTTAFLCL